MAGFLDSKERVIDMVLTDVGKSLLLRGELQFRYWIPYDDEVDYNPVASAQGEQTLEERQLELIESPLVREATMGYRGLNAREEDTTNVHNPMFSAPPGVGHSYPVPRAVLPSGSLNVKMSQQKVSEITQKYNPQTRTFSTSAKVDKGFQRFNTTEELIKAGFQEGAFPEGFQPEGFLVTVYRSGTLGLDELGQEKGGFEEILNNRDSSGNITYRNDIKIRGLKP